MAERRGACEHLPLPLLPLLIASCGEAEEARRGGNVGLTALTPPGPAIITPKQRAETAAGRRVDSFGPQRIRAWA